MVKKWEEITLLSPVIDEATFALEKSRTRKSNTFHASSIEACGRQQWYNIKGYGQQSSRDHPEWTRDAEAGNALHEKYQELLLTTGTVLTAGEVSQATGWTLPDDKYAIEIKVPENEYRIGGRIDAICLLDDIYIVDIKTMKDKHFDKGSSSYKFPKYYAQMQVYMHLSGIHKSIIWAISRNDSRQREYLVHYNPDWCLKQFSRIAQLKILLDTNVLPPAEPDYFECSFCPFQQLCELNMQ